MCVCLLALSPTLPFYLSSPSPFPGMYVNNHGPHHHPVHSIRPSTQPSSFLPFLLPTSPSPLTSTGLPIFCATVFPFLRGTRHLLPHNTSPIHYQHHRCYHRRHRHLSSWPVLFFFFFCCCCPTAAAARVFAVPVSFHSPPHTLSSSPTPLLPALFLPAPPPLLLYFISLPPPATASSLVLMQAHSKTHSCRTHGPVRISVHREKKKACI